MTTSSSGFFSFVVISLERFSAVDFSPLFFWLFFNLGFYICWLSYESLLFPEKKALGKREKTVSQTRLKEGVV